MEAAKEPVKDPASSRPTAGRGNSRKRQRPDGLRSRNKGLRFAVLLAAGRYITGLSLPGL